MVVFIRRARVPLESVGGGGAGETGGSSSGAFPYARSQIRGWRRSVREGEDRKLARAGTKLTPITRVWTRPERLLGRAAPEATAPPSLTNHHPPPFRQIVSYRSAPCSAASPFARPVSSSIAASLVTVPGPRGYAGTARNGRASIRLSGPRRQRRWGHEEASIDIACFRTQIRTVEKKDVQSPSGVPTNHVRTRTPRFTSALASPTP